MNRKQQNLATAALAVLICVTAPGGDSGYSVVQAPAGAMVSYDPQGYTIQTINGTIYHEYGGVNYQPKMVDGGTAYVVVRV